MHLKPLYRLRIQFSQRWSVSLQGNPGREDQVLHDAEGMAEGRISGRFKGTDCPRRPVDGTVVTNLRAVIETTDGASILVECHGYGRVHSPEYDRASGGPRRWVATLTHLSDHEKYRWLNDTVCVGTGHSPHHSKEEGTGSSGFVLDVAELVWEPVQD